MKKPSLPLGIAPLVEYKLVTPKSIIFDGALILVSIIGLNLILAPKDLGWFSLNPSPYLLTPIMMGIRHGYAAGFGTAVATSFILMGYQYFQNGLTPLNQVQTKPYFYVSLAVLGIICGEMQGFFQKTIDQITIQLKHSGGRMRNLDEENYFLREAKDELERIIATRDGELATLDRDMRMLYDCRLENIDHTILNLLCRHARITDAALYRFDNETTLQRSAYNGSSNYLPETLKTGTLEIVMLAIEKRTLVTLPDLWEHNPDPRHQNYLASLPLKDINEQIFAVLLVTGMPFIAMNKKTIRFISLICSWASFIIEARRENPAQFRRAGDNGRFRVYQPTFFKEYLSITYRTHQRFNLISNIAVFTSKKAGGFSQARLEQIILATTRNGDVPGDLDLPFPCVAILLPLTGERGATLFLERILNHAKESDPNGEYICGRLLPFTSFRSHEEIWKNAQKFIEETSQT